MSIQLNSAASKAAKQSIVPLYKSPFQFGIFLSKFNQSQMAFGLLKNLNEFFGKPQNIDIYLYTLEHSLPIIVPPTSLFQRPHLENHEGHLVVTDFQTWQQAIRIDGAKVLFYVYDLLYLSMMPANLLREIQDAGTVCFSHTTAHNNILEKMFKFKVPNKVCHTFNIEQLIGVVREQDARTNFV